LLAFTEIVIVNQQRESGLPGGRSGSPENALSTQKMQGGTD